MMGNFYWFRNLLHDLLQRCWTKTRSIYNKSKYFSLPKFELYSNVHSTSFWNSVLSTKHPDNTVNFLAKAISIDFLGASEKQPTDFFSYSIGNRITPYNVLSIGLHDHSQHCSSVCSWLASWRIHWLIWPSMLYSNPMLHYGSTFYWTFVSLSHLSIDFMKT